MSHGKRQALRKDFPHKGNDPVIVLILFVSIESNVLNHSRTDDTSDGNFFATRNSCNSLWNLVMET
jgi:hypothetical protein